MGTPPLSIAEDIPWRCRRLVIGTGADGALPVMKQIREEARRRKVSLVILPTAEAIDVLAGAFKDTKAVLHLNQPGAACHPLVATWETSVRCAGHAAVTGSIGCGAASQAPTALASSGRGGLLR
jgi:hypothetical protein